MSDEIPESAQPQRRGISPALVMFLIVPLIGLVVAGGVILRQENVIRATQAPATPGAITLPPMPTPISLADTPLVDFALPTLTGDTVNIGDYRGRVIFLNFWATWCVPCQREMPTLAQFVAEQPPDGALVFAVNVEEPRDVVEGFVREYGISGLPILLDEAGTVSSQFGVFQLPVTFVIDGTGVIRYPKYGEITLQELTAYTEALTGEGSS
ncbi:MAG: TlpA family protein disulfide reductase [Anaerolinea sp.]|nr:TlpA family protein disulfide reductase [Anaerolinea sp.]